MEDNVVHHFGPVKSDRFVPVQTDIHHPTNNTLLWDVVPVARRVVKAVAGLELDALRPMMPA